MTTLVTDRLLLRRLTPADAPALHRVTGDPEVMRYWHPGPDRDVAETRARIREIDDHWAAHGFGDWAIVARRDEATAGPAAHGRPEIDDLVGFAGLHHIAGMREVNVGYALARSHWGRGLGTEVARAVLAYGFETVRLGEIVAVMDPRNVASIGLAGRCGLTLRDEILWMGKPRLVYAVARGEWEVRRGGEHW